MTFQLYWGDLHSHCSVSYGHGSAQQALLRARQQLDFCSVTGHAFWPDMPTDRGRYAEIIDYHRAGFDRLAAGWQRLLELNQQACCSDFVAFPSYEWHSLQDGDHNVYSMTNDLPLRDAARVAELRAAVKDREAIVIPHHIGYAAGFRGIDWDQYSEDRSPFVEIYSLHGCSLSEHSPYPMLHDMGPRDFASTAEAGWRRGHRFGIVGGTDHHGAYPGSHGDGRMGVFAETLTRESLWDAMLNRRVYAATGDRIDARFWIDGAWIGSEIENSSRRSIRFQVRGCDALDTVRLLKNGRIIGRFFPPSAIPNASRERYRLRLTWGWGRRDNLVDWEAVAKLSTGTIRTVESCFSGEAVVAPQPPGQGETPDDLDLPHEICRHSDRSLAWRSRTHGNLSMRHSTTQAISLEIEAPLDATLDLEVNGNSYRHTLASLLRASRTHYLRGWLSEAICVGPLIPMEECRLSDNVIDVPENDVDVYRLEVSQANGQWAWLSPIWVRR